MFQKHDEACLRSILGGGLHVTWISPEAAGCPSNEPQRAQGVREAGGGQDARSWWLISVVYLTGKSQWVVHMAGPINGGGTHGADGSIASDNKYPNCLVTLVRPCNVWGALWGTCINRICVLLQQIKWSIRVAHFPSVSSSKIRIKGTSNTF